MVDWLKRFKGHEHLDSKTRREGNCGFPGTYSATFDQLRTTPFTSYLTALGTEPDSSIKVKVIKPQRRFSARELANPYINKDPIVELYDQPIITKNILTQLCNTADALVETWAFHLGEVHKTDLERVKNDRTKNKGLPTTEMIEVSVGLRRASLFARPAQRPSFLLTPKILPLPPPPTPLVRGNGKGW